MHYSINSEYNRACRALIDLAMAFGPLFCGQNYKQTLQTDFLNLWEQTGQLNQPILVIVYIEQNNNCIAFRLLSLNYICKQSHISSCQN